MTSPVLDTVLNDVRMAWAAVDISIIEPEWWFSLLGKQPDDPTQPGDLVLVVLALLDLQNRLEDLGEL